MPALGTLHTINDDRMNTKVKRYFQAVFWIALYLILALAPLFLLLISPIPPGRGFWLEFSVALGFAGLAILCLQFAITSRYKRMKAPYGSDIVYYFHRQISLVAFALVFSHPIILFINDPSTIGLLNLISAPWRARFGVIGAVCLLIVIVTSLWRQRLKIHYDEWRITHGILATLAVALSMGHIISAGHYVNVPWKRELWIGYGVFWVGLLAYTRIIKPWSELRHPYVVEEVAPERGNSWTLTIRPEGHRGLSFQPGQFAWVSIWSTPFADREHPFSFSSSAERTERLSFAIKELGDFTSRIGKLQPGEKVYLDGPHGAFSIDRHPDAAGYAFIAGGIGISPILSMLRTLADREDRRPLLLFYGYKTWEEGAFREELDALAEQLHLKVIPVIEKPSPDWDGERGFVTAELLDRYLPEEREGWEFYICGPLLMMDAVEKALQSLGVPIGNYHSERFNLV